MARVTIPSNADELLALADKIVKKHGADTAGGGTSALTALTNAEGDKPGMADMAAKLGAAGAQHALAGDLSKQADKAYQARDASLGKNVSDRDTVLFYVTAVRDLLLAVNKGREKALGDWGFEVADTPHAKPEAPPAG